MREIAYGAGTAAAGRAILATREMTAAKVVERMMASQRESHLS